MKAGWKNIANRLTGFEISWLGIGASWEPPKLWADVAQEVITFLEDRRCLFRPWEEETPQFVAQSVLQIRQYLTDKLEGLPNEQGLPANLRYMRAACREFNDIAERIEQRVGTMGAMRHSPDVAWEFFMALGQLRATFGTHLAIIAARYKLGIEGDLATILPPMPDDKDGDSSDTSHPPDRRRRK